MTIYLVEFEGFNRLTRKLQTERFGTSGFTTTPLDDPANAVFEEGIIQPGNYELSIFDNGTTSGKARVGFGVIELALDGASRDYLRHLAVKGRPLRIWGLASTRAPWSSRVRLFSGTMEQIEFGWTRASIRIRDRLQDLRKAIQADTFAGTTIAGGMNEAEGTPDDLKERQKPLLWGQAFNFAPPLANRFDRLYLLSSTSVAEVQAVRDAGVPLAFAANYATLADLRTAAIPAGRYATCLAAGLIRIGSAPLGDITVDAAEGPAGSRSAARTARRMIERAGFVAGRDFLAPSFDALHDLNPAEVGMWIAPGQADLLGCVTGLLDSIGGYIVPDREARFRVGRVDLPSAGGSRIDHHIALSSGEGIARLATNDPGRGVEAAKVTIQYAVNYTQQTGTALAGAATDAVKAFAKDAYRTVFAENPLVREAQLDPPELTFSTFLTKEADARLEAGRRLGVYSADLDRFKVRVPVTELGAVDLGDDIVFAMPRFGLDEGKPFLVIGSDVNFMQGVVSLDLFG